MRGMSALGADEDAERKSSLNLVTAFESHVHTDNKFLHTIPLYMVPLGTQRPRIEGLASESGAVRQNLNTLS